MNILGKIFLAIGKSLRNDNRATRIRNYSGHQENKGTIDNEEWTWTERIKFQPIYIHVLEISSDYVIVLSKHKNTKSIDTLRCYSQLQLDVATEIVTNHYARFGNVVIDRT